jgi:mycothiol synthase
MGKNGGEGMKLPRPFQDEHDLSAMCEVLVQGRRAENGAYYVHTGDIKWWLYYPPLEGDFWKHIYLWDDPEKRGRLLGWALISPDWVGLDVYVQPELRGSIFARDMYLWAEERATQVARQKGKQNIYALWVSHEDEFLVEHFTQRGFRLRRGMTHMTRTLKEKVQVTKPVRGFVLRDCGGEPEVRKRARAQYGAFGSKAPFAQYEGRFRNFMRSPVYQPELDIVAVAADGQIGAFCIIWIDLANQVGLFEPVGTHPDFQRRGLARAVLYEGLHRMQEYGMRSAIVSTYEDNFAAIKLYEAVGFQVMNQLGTFEKDV